MDPYTLCPCGSGKKLKFCCSDLIGEIEKVHRMIEGDQPRAALRHVEQTLAKRPGRASLLDLQAMLQMSLGENEAATATVDEFIRVDPDSPSAYAHRAMLLAEQEDAEGAVEALQAALDRVETNLPQRVLEAIGSVGHVLLLIGDVVAARAHLWLYEAIAGGQDHRALELLVRMNQVSGLPLMLRDRMALRGLPAGHPLAAEVETIQRMAAAGRWRSAAAQIDDLLPDHLDVPLLIYNRALLSGYMADPKNFAAGLRLYARQDVPLDDAVEAEAIAQLVDTDSQDPPTKAVRLSFAIQNEDALIERLIGNSRVQQMSLSNEQLEAFEGPKPRGYYVLLDRDMPTDVEHLTRDQIPNILGFVSQYGRQTDRAERVELITDEGLEIQSVVEAIRAATGDTLGDEIDRQPAGESQGGDPALSWRWHMPKETPPQKRRELLTEERRAALLERWPDAPRQALGGKSPREAAGDIELRLPLSAAVLLLEQGSANTGFGETFVELRDLLGLPQHEVVPGNAVDAGEVPIVRVQHLALADFDNQELALLYKRCVLVSANEALLAVVREALRRDDFDRQVPADTLYEQLFSLEDDTEGATRVLEEARSAARAKGESCGKWDLLELQLHITEGNSEGANRVLTHLRDEHMDEPEIAEQIYQLLYMIGAIPAEGGMPGQPPLPPGAVPAPAAAESDAGIWTPDSATQSTGKSKLWTPD